VSFSESVRLSFMPSSKVVMARSRSREWLSREATRLLSLSMSCSKVGAGAGADGPLPFLGSVMRKPS
jgi:hypothetical protein